MDWFQRILSFVVLVHLVSHSFSEDILPNKSPCPKECKCSKTVVNCQNKKLTAFPRNIPNTTTALYLSNNFITKIKPDDLEELTRLQALYLQHNKLTEVPDFGNLISLKKLSLDFNYIQSARIPKGFQKLFSLTSITMTTNKITGLGKNDFLNLGACPLKKLSLSRNVIKNINSHSFVPLRQLTSLKLSYTNSLSVKQLQNLAHGFENSSLISLDVSGSNFKGKLPATTLQQLPKTMTTLMLRDNSIIQIENNTFMSMPNLIILDITNSRLQFVQNNAFSGLRAIKDLRMSQNYLRNIPVNLPISLEKLQLASNTFMEITSSKFLNLGKLTNLDLHGSTIVQVTSEAFVGLKALKILDLSYNKLNKIGTTVFSYLPNLQILLLNNNNIVKFDKSKFNVFGEQKQLQFLDISHNGVDFLPENVFMNLTQLQWLIANNNNIGQTLQDKRSSNLFQYLKGLQWLDLSGNQIEGLPENVFYHLESLEVLNLTGNRISYWSSNQFKGLRKLHTIDLNSNVITTINQSSIVPQLEHVWNLNLSNNILSCDCDLRWFRQYINHTQIRFTKITKYVCAAPPDFQGKKFLEFQPDMIVCSPSNQFIIYISICGGAVVFIILMVSLSTYHWRWYLKLKLFRCKNAVRGKRRLDYENRNQNIEDREEFLSVDDDVRYDAYVSFAEEDREWVARKLLPMIDHGGLGDGIQFEGRFQIYYDERDMMLGDNVIDATVKGIESSEKSIVVFSKSYASSGRCIDVDLSLILDKPRHQKVILILLEEVPLRKIPRCLHSTLWKNQHLLWTTDVNGQALFWEMLNNKMMENGIEEY